MPEMETAGSVSQSLAADDKEDLHEFLPDELVLIPDEMLVLPTGSRNRFPCLPGAGFFRGDNPCNETDDESGPKGEVGFSDPYQPYDRRVYGRGFTGAGTGTSGHLPFSCMVQPLHVDEFGFKD